MTRHFVRPDIEPMDFTRPTRLFTADDLAEVERMSGVRKMAERMSAAFVPEDTPPARADKYEADKAIDDMDEAYIRPVFFTVVLLAMVVMVLAIVTGTECAGCGL